MNDPTQDPPSDDPSQDPLVRGMQAAFPQPASAPAPGASILDILAKQSGLRPRVALRDEPSAHGDRPLKPLAGSGDTVPQTTGKYHIQGELARGGVGAVYKGHDTDLGRDVAMKLLHEEFLDNPDVVGRFVEEAQIGGQLQHPGIVPVYDLGLSGERPYFTMKLIKGQTLASILEDRDEPKENRRRLLSIFEQVCQTMAYAHSRGVIHRDLKPANIMVGAFGEVQVVDWGMGKVLPRGGVADEARTRQRAEVSVIETIRSDGEGSKSLVGSVMGTPSYMPPEQANGAVEQMDERSDVFALGAVLCEILTGRPPYVGSGGDILIAAAKAELGPCQDRLAGCGADPELVELTRDCLMPVPATRPRDARKLAQRITEHLAALEERARQAQIEAAQHQVEAVAARRSQRLTLALATSVVGMLSIAGGGYWWIQEQRRERAATGTLAIERALGDAAVAYDRAQHSEEEDLALWTEAAAAAERAQALLGTTEVDDVLRQRVEETVTRLEAARERAGRVALESQMVARLERIADPGSVEDEAGRWVNPFRLDYCEERDADYRRAFQEFGLPLEEMDHNQAVLALLEVPDPPVWLSALDDWAMALEVIHGESWPARDHLLEIVAELDESPFRVRWLDLLLRGDITRESVADLLADSEAGSMSASAALAVATRLNQLDAHDLYLEVLHRAQRIHPDNFWIVTQLAQAHHSGNYGPVQTDEALRFFTAATSLRPNHLQATYERGHCAEILDRLEEALACYRIVLAADPGHARALQQLTTTLEATGDEAGAREALREVLERDLDNAGACNSLAWWLANTASPGFRDPATAVTLARRAVELAPGTATYHNTLGVALYRAGEFEEAEEALRRSLRRAESAADRAFDQLYLAMVLHQLGRADEAERFYQEARPVFDAMSSLDEDEKAALAETRELLEVNGP